MIKHMTIFVTFLCPENRPVALHEPHNTQFTSYEFNSTSYKFESTSYEFKLTSYEFKSKSYEFKSTS